MRGDRKPGADIAVLAGVGQSARGGTAFNTAFGKVVMASLYLSLSAKALMASMPPSTNGRTVV